MPRNEASSILNYVKALFSQSKAKPLLGRALKYSWGYEQVLVLVVGIGRRKDGDKKDIYPVLAKLLEESLEIK